MCLSLLLSQQTSAGANLISSRIYTPVLTGRNSEREKTSKHVDSIVIHLQSLTVRADLARSISVLRLHLR